MRGTEGVPRRAGLPDAKAEGFLVVSLDPCKLAVAAGRIAPGWPPATSGWKVPVVTPILTAAPADAARSIGKRH